MGKAFTITVSNQGEVTSVKGLNELMKSIVDPSTPNAAAVSQQLGRLLNDDDIKSSMSQSFNIYPDHPVKPGDTWTKDASLNMGGLIKMTTKTTYKLSSVDNGVAHLAASSNINAVGAVPLTGTQTGTMDVETATGMVLDAKMKQSLNGPGGAGRGPARP